MRSEPIPDPDGDRIAAMERRDREREKGSHPATFDPPPRPCPLCKATPKNWNGDLVCACSLPVGTR